MPGFYPEDEYDLAGFSVGLADQEHMLDGSSMAEGDILIGLASSGVHSNGFSLVRKVLNVTRERLAQPVAELGCTLGEALLKPTRIYVKAIQALLTLSSRGEAIGEQNVRYVIGLVRSGKESQITELTGDVLCISAKGRPLAWR